MRSGFNFEPVWRCGWAYFPFGCRCAFTPMLMNTLIWLLHISCGYSRAVLIAVGQVYWLTGCLLVSSGKRYRRLGCKHACNLVADPSNYCHCNFSYSKSQNGRHCGRGELWHSHFLHTLHTELNITEIFNHEQRLYMSVCFTLCVFFPHLAVSLSGLGLWSRPPL